MNTGVVAAYQCIFRTTDGGATWDTCTGVTAQIKYHYKFSFINSSTGFITGSSGRVFKTTDAGISWTALTNAGSDTKFCIYAISENIIMVGEDNADLWRTTNGGTNWYEINLSGSYFNCINFIDASTGFCVGYGNLCYKTTNAGANWTSWNTGLPYSSYNDIDFGPPGTPTGMANESFTGTTYPPTGWRRVNVLGSNQWYRYTSLYLTSPASARIQYQSTGGEDWLITPQIPVGGSDSLVFWARRYYTSINNPDSLIIRISTTDTAMSSFTNVLGRYNVNSFGTTTWSRVALPMGTYAGNAYVAFQHKDIDGNGLMIDDVSVGLNSPSPSPQVYLTGDTIAIYRSPSGLAIPSWDTVGFIAPNQTKTATYYSTSLASNGDSLLTVGEFGLINKRNNISNRWNPRPDWTWMTSYINFGIGIIGSRIMMPTSYSTIWYSTNNGTNWDTMRTNTSYSGTLYNICTYGNNVWVCGESGKVNKSTDGGVTWTEINDIGYYSLLSINFVDANTGWIFGSAGCCYKTTNGGTNFTQQTIPGQTSSIYSSSFIDANTGWNCGSGGKVYKTTNGGINWVAQTSNFSSYFRGMDMVNANTGWMVGYTGCVRKTINGGTNWDTVHMPCPTTSYNNLYSVDFIDQYNGMVAGRSGQTYRTRDGGTTWIYENVGGGYINAVKMQSSDSGWAGGYGGYIFKYADEILNGNTYTHIVPDTYELNQNYPNPFNPTTTIQFALPKAGRVSLKVYDVSGRLVRTLINNEGLNEGTFKHIFDGSDVASGVYFYSLIVDGNLIGSMKMVLIK